MKLKNLFIIGLLLPVAFVSCTQKEEPFEEPEEVIPPQEEEGGFAYLFKVSDETRTVFGTDHVVWEADDQVGSYSAHGSSKTLNKSTGVTMEGGVPHIYLRSNVALSAGDMAYFYYPHNSRNNNAEATAVTLEIPRNQISGSADAMPMVALPYELTEAVASYTNVEVPTLQFMNLGSIIKLNIFSSNASFQGETIENVTFQAGAACAGTFTYDITGMDVENPAAISGYTETDVVVAGDGANPIVVGADKDHAGVFYIIVAPGTYGGSFVVRTSRADYTYVSGTNREYSRATVKPFNIDLASTNWTVNTGYDTSIDSPREFAAFLAGTSASDTGSYTISTDLDMTGYTITSASGFGGSLNGQDYTISNLTSSVPMFATNAGSISNLTIDESCVFSTVSNIFGALVKEDNGGTYNSVRNRAAVTYTASGNVTDELMIGSLIGKAIGATLTGCTNGGAVSIQAAGYGHKAAGLGGIVGYAEGTTFDSCINRGTVTLNADYGDPINTLNGRSNAGIAVGGILGNGYDHGKDYYCTFRSCQNESAGVITLNHTRLNGLSTVSSAGYVCVGGVVGKARGNMKACKNFAPINVNATTSDRSIINYQNYCIYIGGVVGGARWAISLESCRNDGAITVEYDGKYNGNRNRSSIGGICGWQDYDSSDVTTNQADIFAYYCTQRGSITVRAGAAAVGGIFGFSGKQIGNTVYSSCTIDYTGQQGHVGGLVGRVEDNPETYTIKNCRCEATIVAEDLNSDDKYYSVGGLIGSWGRASSKSENWSCLTARDGSACSFAGSVSSTTVSRVGIAVGYIATTSSNQNLRFGDADNKIKASGSFGKKGLDITSIDALNVKTYAIGANEGATVTVNIEYPTEITLMSFNIKGSDYFGNRRSEIISMIKGEQPDVIALQEVDKVSWVADAGGTQPWSYLTSELISPSDAMYSGYRPGEKTNAILYNKNRFELTGTGFFYLGTDYNTSGTSNSWDDYERTVVYGTLRNKYTDNHYFVMATHFPMNQQGQTGSTALIESRLAALNTNNYPVILMGDMNCVNGNTCWDSIKNSMRNAVVYAKNYYSEENKALYTYNAFGDSSKDRFKVDLIWTSHPAIKIDYYITLTQEIRQYGNVAYLSDHYPIIAIVENR